MSYPMASGELSQIQDARQSYTLRNRRAAALRGQIGTCIWGSSNCNWFSFYDVSSPQC
jgi:hypothetical protein